ncbi:Replication protein A1-like protein [Corchorus olitorius]|uniref:Replication protein A1-like protein n=1 Tax=Corchorus olitorius TaxID=93759 RepID=A0A1R3L1E4_9ROSI|nr:Replication protein A1-like protein [Corchorus olitorius]
MKWIWHIRCPERVIDSLFGIESRGSSTLMLCGDTLPFCADGVEKGGRFSPSFFYRRPTSHAMGEMKCVESGFSGGFDCLGYFFLQLPYGYFGRDISYAWASKLVRIVRHHDGSNGLLRILALLRWRVLLLSSDSCSTFHVLGNLLQDCRGLLREFDHILVRHVLRGGNKCADYLASLAQSSSHGLTLLEEPPAALGPLLQADRLGKLNH